MNRTRITRAALVVALSITFTFLTSSRLSAAEAPQWVSSAAVGATLTRGNSDTFLGTLTANTERKWDQHELSLGADAAYGTAEIDGEETTTAKSMRGHIQYNRLFNERLYGYARVEALHDQIADIQYRISLSPGVGYYVIKEETIDLSFEVGPGVVFDKLGDDTRSYATLRVAEKFNYQLSDRARLWQMLEVLPQIDRFSNYIINFELGLEADLTADKRLALRAVIQDVYNNEPADGRKKNDVKLITALAYKF
jgi:putative salt-induced outer membrane protein YdiY